MLSVPETDFKISLAALLAVVALVVAPILSAAEPVVHRGTITAFKLNIRSEPSRNSAVIATVSRGTQVDVIKVSGGIGGWLTVIYQGQEGYVRNRPRYIALSPGISMPPKVLKPKADKPDPQAARQHAAITEKLEKETRKMAQFSKKETEILDGLNEIDYALNQSRIRSQALAKENLRLASEIRSIQDKIHTLNQSMATTREYAGQRLEALYRMHMIGRLEMAGPPASLFDFFVTQRAVKQVVASDYTLLSAQARDLSELVRLKKTLEEQVTARTALESDLALQIRIKEKESQKKETILGEIREKKQLSQAAIASLEQAAESLAERLEGMGLSGSPELDDATFARQRGQLSAPVDGRIISRFGKSRNGNYNAFTFQSGIDIKVQRGEPVRSVFKGEVMFSDWLKGYGNLIIINHGDNYYTLYAHVEEMFKKKGDTVGTGEVIATAGDTGSIKGICLHFEVRHHGKPVNPMTWLKKGA
jgi:septal ring factor EnvC (AmiA/AmiB activator)